MIKKTPLLFLFVFNFSSYAQLGKESWNWQFGSNASLNFSTGTPVAGTSAINTTEGSASYSDPNTGQLLFYSDGTSVWNKNNIQMPNGFGLLGNGSSTQSAVIVPKPGSTTLYYIITADQGGYGGPNQGVNYSVVDMSLNGGLGDVTTKNVLLTPPPTTEKVVAVSACGGNFWVLTHPFNSNAFNAYKVTSSGINPVPVVSNVGTVHQDLSGGTFVETIGYMKASPNGKKLAIGIYEVIPILEIFDFDNITGLVTNPITVNYSGGSGPYGVSFSPDNSKIYAGIFDAGELYQYDLSSGVAATIIGSQTLIATVNTAGSFVSFGALQIASDGKIYCANFTSTLYVINNPNALGAACNFQFSGPSLSMLSAGGLPNFIDAAKASSGSITNLASCNSFSTEVLSADTGFTNYQWSTGATTPTISIASPGTYWVNASSASGCSVIDTIHAFVIQTNTVNILKDTTLCSATGNYQANATFNGATGYTWVDGTTNAAATFTTSGTYWVDIHFAGSCVVRDSFHLILHQKPIINLPNDTVLCVNPSQPIVLNAGAGVGYFYNWSTTATTQTISVNNAGVYYVTVNTATNCFATDTFKLQIINAVSVNLLRDTILCSTSQIPFNLNATVSGNNNFYFWQDGNSSPIETVTAPGTYYVDIYVNGGVCVISDTAHVTIGNTINLNIPDVLHCNTFTTDTLNAGTGYTSYNWSNSITTLSITINSPGVYWVTVTSAGGCSATDTIHAYLYTSTPINILKDTTVCLTSGNYTAVATTSLALAYSWIDGTHNTTDVFLSSGNYWVDISENAGCKVRDSFNLVLNYKPQFSLGNDINLCAQSYTLTGNTQSPYMWNTGATTQQITVTTSGTYWLEEGISSCSTIDSIHVNLFLPPVIDFLHDTSKCSNVAGNIVVNATYPNTHTYLWDNGNTNPVHSIVSPGIYWVEYTLNDGCTTRDSFSYTIKSPPLVNLGNDTTFCVGSLLLDATNASSVYLWNTGSTNSTILVTTSGVYWVNVNKDGCTSSDTLTVFSLANQSSTILFPNIVTPNNDNINDYVDFGKFGFTTLELEIYDRWGNKIYESFDPTCIWKPTAIDGTYFWVASYKLNCSTQPELQKTKGFITIAR